MTSKKIPKVTIVAGKVKKTKIGLTNKFSKAKTNATPNAPKNPETDTPGKMYDNPITMAAVIRKLNNVFIFVKF